MIFFPPLGCDQKRKKLKVSELENIQDILYYFVSFIFMELQ